MLNCLGLCARGLGFDFLPSQIDHLTCMSDVRIQRVLYVLVNSTNMCKLELNQVL